MDPVRNPYQPGAGRKPAAFVGRDEALREWQTDLQRAEKGRSIQPTVLYGLRGVGKTVLLAELRRNAARRDWIVAQAEAGSGRNVRELIGEALYAPLSDLARPSAGRRLVKALKTAVSFKASYDIAGRWTFGLDLSETVGGGADTGVLETDLRKLVADLAGAAEEEGVGVAILIDEAQDLSVEELTTLSVIAHASAQEDWPVAFAFAGLPSLPRILAEARSYAERFRYVNVRELDDDAAAAALTIPAGEEDAEWEEAAVEVVVRESGRYPYFLQQFGQDTWNVAAGPVITVHDAELGVARGNQQLDTGFFRVRWDRASRGEQDYLRAMAQDGDGGSQSGEVASRLRRSSASFGPIRANLINKGIIYAPEYGVVAFTVPGMAAFVLRQLPA